MCFSFFRICENKKKPAAIIFRSTAGYRRSRDGVGKLPSSNREILQFFLWNSSISIPSSSWYFPPSLAGAWILLSSFFSRCKFSEMEKNEWQYKRNTFFNWSGIRQCINKSTCILFRPRKDGKVNRTCWMVETVRKNGGFHTNCRKLPKIGGSDLIRIFSPFPYLRVMGGGPRVLRH